jgi:hypothetical protein
LTNPDILIAGRAWEIPLLAPRQNRTILPLLLEGRRDYAALCDIVFAALTRAHPQLTRAEFEEWPLPAYELARAVSVIAQQTGFVERSRGAARCELPDWDAIIAQFCNFLPGTTPDYWENALTAPRLKAMQEEWRIHPPVAALVAAYLGYKPKPRELDAVEELMRLFPNGHLRLH